MNEFLQGLWPADFSTPLQIPQGATVFLVAPSEIRKNELLHHARDFAPDRLQILDFKDLVQTLFLEIPDTQNFQLSTDLQAQHQLALLWDQNQDLFPTLSAEFKGLESSQLFLSDLYRELQEARLFAHDFNEVFPVYPEYSADEANRCAELTRLLELHEQQQLDAQQADFLTTVRSLIQQIQKIAPNLANKTFLLDQIFLNSQLEELFFGLLIEFSQQSIWIEPSYLHNPPKNAEKQPSFDAFYRTSECLSRVQGPLQKISLKKTSKHRENLVQCLFDGQKINEISKNGPISLEKIQFWSCHNPRAEVQRSFSMLLSQNWLKDGQIVVAVPDLEAYRGLFQEYAQQYKMDCVFEFDAPAYHETALRQCLSTLKWLENGNIEDFLVFFEGQNANRHSKLDLKLEKTDILKAFGQFKSLANTFSQLNAKIDEENQKLLDNLAEQNKTDQKADLFELISIPDTHQFDPARLHCAMRRAQLPGGLDFESDWLSPLLLAMRSWIEHEDLHWLFSVLCDLTYLAQIHSLFDQIRKHTQFGNFFAEFSQIFTASGPRFDELWSQLSRLATLSDQDSLNFESITSLIQFIRQQIRRLPRHSLKNHSAQLIVVNWDQAHSYCPNKKYLIILGLTAMARPNYNAPIYQLKLIKNHQDSFRYQRGAYFRRFFTLALTSQTPVILSAPRIQNNVEVPTAPPLKTLKNWLKNGSIQLETIQVEPVLTLEQKASTGQLDALDAIDPKLKQQIIYAEKAIQSRGGPRFTAFDGDLSEIADQLNHDKPNVYSPTVLEIMADCRHRHFFKNMLYLPEFPEVREELPRHEVGTAVHECLELFWLSEKWTGGPITAANFGKACELMQEIAEDVLSKSGIDWDRGPLRRVDKRAMLRGLDDVTDQSRRGMLRAALAFQRDLPYISGPAFKTEYPFGMSGDPSVPVTDRVSVRGIIDRIDPIKDSQQNLIGYLVLDYKTGHAKTISDVNKGLALQIAIYAFVVQNRFALEDQPLFVRGGLLTLKEPDRRPDPKNPLDHPLRGIYREHLAVVKKRSWTNVDGSSSEHLEVVEERLEKARERIAVIDNHARHGRLWQEIAPKACNFCDYRNICQHDEKLVELKTRNFELAELHDSTQQLFDQLTTADANLGSEHLIQELQDEDSSDSEQARPGLSEEQERAANVHHSVSVSAGAGSGKTFILKARVARLVRAGVPIQNILALTFTEMAAAEIRHRIEQSLSEALELNELDGTPLNDKERELFIRARADIELASISTIHSLCQTLIQFDPGLAGVSGQLQIVTGQELAEIQRHVIRQVFADDSKVAAEIEELLESGLTSYKIRGQIRQRLSAEDRVGQLSQSLNRSDEHWREQFPKILEHHCQWQLEGILDQLWKLFEEATEWTDSDAAHSYLAKNNRQHHFFVMLDQLEQTFDAVQNQNWSGAVEQLQTCLAQILVAHPEVKFRKNKASFPVNYWNEVRDLIKGLKLEPFDKSFEAELESVRLGRVFLKIVQEAQQLYRQQKRQKNLIDFDELISRAHKMLVNEPQSESLKLRQDLLIQRLKQRFQHLLIDEFQDTDQRQWQILQRFLNTEQQPDQPLPSSMFIVGDPKQSIYGWRHSDNRVFAAARNQLETSFQGQSVTLSDNYRSSREVLHWVNVFFDRVFASEFKNDEEKWVDTAVSAQAMNVKNENVPGSVQILWLPKKKKSNQYSLFDEAERTELQHIAELTESVLLGDPRFPISATKKGPKIGILCRTTRVLRAMGQALDMLNIPYSSTHRAGFFSQPAILTLENALRAMVYEKDDISLVGLMRSEIFSFSDVELLVLRKCLRQHSKLRGIPKNWTEILRDPEFCIDSIDNDLKSAFSDDLLVKLERFLDQYQNWKQARYNLSCANFIRMIIHQSGLQISYSRTKRQASSHNLWRFIELIEELEQSGLNDLVELLDWMNSERLSAPEGAAMLPADDLPVVLTTIHGSKGLEFPIVILPDLSRRSQQRHDFIEVELPGEDIPSLGLRVMKQGEGIEFKRESNLLTSVLSRHANSRNLSEEKRLFYVACTRAVNHLILPLQANSTSNFEELPLVASERLQKLRQASSHKALIFANGQPNDHENPKKVRFETESDHVEISVIDR